MTYGASRLDLLLIERLILYLLAKWSGSMSAENIHNLHLRSHDFPFLFLPSFFYITRSLNNRFERSRSESSDPYGTHKSRYTHRRRVDPLF